MRCSKGFDLRFCERPLCRSWRCEPKAVPLRMGRATRIILVESGAPTRANISLDACQLEAIDEVARRRSVTRSTFLVSTALDKIAEGG